MNLLAPCFGDVLKGLDQFEIIVLDLVGLFFIVSAGRLSAVHSFDEADVNVARLRRLIFNLLQLLVVPHHGLVILIYVLLVDQPHVVMTSLRVPHY